MSEGLQTAAIYTDFQGFDALRKSARDHSPDALRKVAQQFEALFTQMMLKNMRDASFGDDLFGSDEAKFYQGMFDQQIALHLSSTGGMGLADLLVRQLGGAQSGRAEASADAAAKGVRAYSGS
jgi:flagellar protein FlgJ